MIWNYMWEMVGGSKRREYERKWYRVKGKDIV